MSRRSILFLVLAALAAAVFIRLGVWQLSRLGERRARNALITARLDSAPVLIQSLPHDIERARYRRVHVFGTFDYEHELVLAGRTHDGSPGVNIITPLRLIGSSTGPAVLVDRGWVYSPDGASIDLARWHDDSGTVLAEGYVEAFPAMGALHGPISPLTRPNVVRWLDANDIARRVGYSVTPYYVVLQGDTLERRDSLPVKLAPPSLDEGPHKSYAAQWFAFAAIALGGAVAVARGDVRRRRRASRVTVYEG